MKKSKPCPCHEPEVLELKRNPRPKAEPRPEPKELHLSPDIWKKPKYYGLTGSQLLDSFLYIVSLYWLLVLIK